jgi:hypothetical protein
LRDYCATIPQGNAYNANGSAAVVAGTLTLNKPTTIDELEANAANAIAAQNALRSAVPQEVCAVVSKTIALAATATVAGSVLTIVPSTTGTTNPGTMTVVDFGQGTQDISAPYTHDYSTAPDGSYIVNVWTNDANGASISVLSTVNVVAGIPSVPVFVPKSVTYEEVTRKGLRTFLTTGVIESTFDVNGVAFTALAGETIKLCEECDCSEKPTDCYPSSEAATPIVGLTSTITHINTNLATAIASGYKSVSVTAISADCTIEGQTIPQAFNWSVNSSTNERFTDTVAITGTDYIVTEVR